MSFDLILPFMRPIEALLLDREVSEIMGNPDSSWWIERDGALAPACDVRFDAAALRTGLEVIANHLGKKLDDDNPLLTARLPDGSRLAGLIQPLVGPAPALTIRKFTSRDFTVDDLIERGEHASGARQDPDAWMSNGYAAHRAGPTADKLTRSPRI